MFALDKIVPWGRSFDEYCRMFSLTDIDLAGRILGCADGPAGFNAEATRRGGHVVSFDPIYALSTSEIRGRIAATSQDILEQTRQNQHEFVWTSITSPEELLDTRMTAMDLFLADYDAGKVEGRYITAELPVLPFGDHTFDLAVCSHFLFFVLRSARYRLSSCRDSRALPRGERSAHLPIAGSRRYRFLTRVPNRRFVSRPRLHRHD